MVILTFNVPVEDGTAPEAMQRMYEMAKKLGYKPPALYQKNELLIRTGKLLAISYMLADLCKGNLEVKKK